MAPRVGIPMCLDDRERWRRGRVYLYIDRAYADAVTEAGGVPVHLPPQDEVGALFETIDALVIPGGDDFAPLDAAGYTADVRFDTAPDAQLAFDRSLLAGALARKIPVLGICYGMQLLALEHGGSLHYHLPIDCPDAGPHTLAEDDGRHRVQIEPKSRLAAALAGTTGLVNSLHHQAVADPGNTFQVVARAEDGVIEAIEAPNQRFCVGVQWHPEKLEGEDRAALFRALLHAAEAGC